MYLENSENIRDHKVLINAFINDKVKLSRKEFLDRLKHVKFLRTIRNSGNLRFYICSFDDYNNLKKFHNLVNYGTFDFEPPKIIFAIAIQSKLYNWFKTTNYPIIERQISCWLAGLYFFAPEKRHIMEEQIYPPLFEEIIKLTDKYYKDYQLPNFQELTEEFYFEANEENHKILTQEIIKAENKYLEVCKDFYKSEPPEILVSPFDYKYIEGWSLTEPTLSDRFSFDLIQCYFQDDDWKGVFVDGMFDDAINRAESRADLWEKWKHTFGTFDERKNFVYDFFYNSEIELKSNTKNKKREGIPQDVRDIVWKRDNGKCVECGSNEKLEFDHIIPFSKGGSSTYRNLQLLCETHNRKKHDNI